MTLQEALTEAARVAVAEGAKHDLHGYLFYADTQAEANLIKAARVNAAVFAWWADNAENVMVRDGVSLMSLHKDEMLATLAGEA